ncbi:MAG: hypothetical protein AAGA20_22730 [Planctomycetota bacterium]
MSLPHLFATGLGAYLAVGFVFAIAFSLFGAARIDPDARGATIGFRILVVPGATLLWPLLARRWITGAPPPEERTPHKRAIDGGRS